MFWIEIYVLEGEFALMKKPILIKVLRDIAKRQGGDLSWLDVGVKFVWENALWIIDESGRRICFKEEAGKWFSSPYGEVHLIRMLQNANTIQAYKNNNNKSFGKNKKKQGANNIQFKTILIDFLQEAAKNQEIDLSWLDVGVKFIWNDIWWMIDENGLRKFFQGDKGNVEEWIVACYNEEYLIQMIETTESIMRAPLYTASEAEQAENDMQCSAKFTFVSKDVTGQVDLWCEKPYLSALGDFRGKSQRIRSHYHYPTLEAGTLESLEVIAGCHNE